MVTPLRRELYREVRGPIHHSPRQFTTTTFGSTARDGQLFRLAAGAPIISNFKARTPRNRPLEPEPGYFTAG